MTARLKALGVAEPVLDLDKRKNRIDQDWSAYQMAELALAAVDFVTVRMDFRIGVAQEDVVHEVAAVAAIQLPQRSAKEHRAVARWVIDQLINVGNLDRGFTHLVGTTVNGQYQIVEFPFTIFDIKPDGRGDSVLSASNAAINVLLNALDVDVESAQVAAEAKLATLVKRGRLTEALLTARSALHRSSQFGQELQRRLDMVRRDIRLVNWQRDLETVVSDALEHVRERTEAELVIKANVTTMLDTLDDPESRAPVVELIDLLDQCLQRHARLESALLQVGAEFRAEQNRQVFVPLPSRNLVQLYSQLLVPVMQLQVQEAVEPLERFGYGISGPEMTLGIELSHLWELLGSPTDEEVDELDLIEDRVWEERAQGGPFDAESQAAADELMFGIDEEPARLSEMLRRAEQRELTGGFQDLRLLVMMEAARAFGAPITKPLGRGERPLIAVDDGQVLNSQRFSGSDLLLVRVSLPILPAGTDVVSDPPRERAAQ